MRKTSALGLSSYATAVVAACSSAPPPPAAPLPTLPKEEAAEPELAVEAEIGALSDEAVERTFRRVSRKLGDCFAAGAGRIPYLAGDVRLALRIKKDGSPRWAYVKASTLGDRETEECMIQVVMRTDWPKPKGGEGLAESSFTFEPLDDARPATAWLADKGSKVLQNAHWDLDQCRKQTGAGKLTATVYVDPAGKPVSVGIATADEKSDGAIACVVERLKRAVFPIPGTLPAKVTLDLP